MIDPLTWKYGREFHNLEGNRVNNTPKPIHTDLKLTNEALRDDELFKIIRRLFTYFLSQISTGSYSFSQIAVFVDQRNNFIPAL
mgnify:CR=1 FL=1